MRRPHKLQVSLRTLLVATSVTAAIAAYFAFVFPPRLQNKHAIEVLVSKHRASFVPDGFHGPLWMRAMLDSEYTMGIDYLCYDSPQVNDSSIQEIAIALRSLPSPVRHIEFRGTNVTASGLEKLRSTMPACEITASGMTPLTGPVASPGTTNGVQ